MGTIDASGAPAGYRIAEVGRLTGLAPARLRFYESAGVLPPPERTPAGYRLYDDRAVERLRLVARAKDLGCTLDEIAGLVEIWDADACEPVRHRLWSLVDEKIVAVERHIAEHDCCPFLTSAVTVDARGAALEITAPPDRRDLLAALVERPVA